MFEETTISKSILEQEGSSSSSVQNSIHGANGANDLEWQNTSSENSSTHAEALARANTFSNWVSSVDSPNYNRYEDDYSVIDVETWNWPVLLTRVFCFFLLFLMIVLFGLGAINTNFDILATFVFIILSIILINTYIDLRVLAFRCLCRFFCSCRERKQKPNISTATPSDSPQISNAT